jgi:hypothetical protein
MADVTFRREGYFGYVVEGECPLSFKQKQISGIPCMSDRTVCSHYINNYENQGSFWEKLTQENPRELYSYHYFETECLNCKYWQGPRYEEVIEALKDPNKKINEYKIPEKQVIEQPKPKQQIDLYREMFKGASYPSYTQPYQPRDPNPRVHVIKAGERVLIPVNEGTTIHRHPPNENRRFSYIEIVEGQNRDLGSLRGSTPYMNQFNEDEIKRKLKEQHAEPINQKPKKFNRFSDLDLV